MKKRVKAFINEGSIDNTENSVPKLTDEEISADFFSLHGEHPKKNYCYPTKYNPSYIFNGKTWDKLESNISVLSNNYEGNGNFKSFEDESITKESLNATVLELTLRQVKKQIESLIDQYGDTKEKSVEFIAPLMVIVETINNGLNEE